MFAYAKTEQKQESKSTAQKKSPKNKVAVPNQTGIPDATKAQFENLSGFSFDDVHVHYNSNKPAQLQALACTQGNQVYVAPGQEMCLKHELGHVVQQKQGRVKPIQMICGIPMNNDPVLETEADAEIIQRRKLNPSIMGSTIQCAFDSDHTIKPAASVSGYEKAIPQSSDIHLNEIISSLISFVEGKVSEGKAIFLYMATGTANGTANGTSFSTPDLATKEKLERQKSPGITTDAEIQGYYVITVNIDEFGKDSIRTPSENRKDFVIHSVFPVSGKCMKPDGSTEPAVSIAAIRHLYDVVYASSNGSIKGQVVLLNAIEDVPTEDEFRLFTGMKELMQPNMTDKFTYATSYLQDERRAKMFNLYKFLYTKKSGALKGDLFLQNKNTDLDTVAELFI